MPTLRPLFSQHQPTRAGSMKAERGQALRPAFHIHSNINHHRSHRHRRSRLAEVGSRGPGEESW